MFKVIKFRSCPHLQSVILYLSASQLSVSVVRHSQSGRIHRGKKMYGYRSQNTAFLGCVVWLHCYQNTATLRVACEDTRRAVYSQLPLHVTGKYIALTSKLVSVVKTTECCRPSSLHAASLTLAKVRNFEPVASKTLCEHATSVLAVYKSVTSKNAGVQRVKTPSFTIRQIHNFQHPGNIIFLFFLFFFFAIKETVIKKKKKKKKKER